MEFHHNQSAFHKVRPVDLQHNLDNHHVINRMSFDALGRLFNEQEDIHSFYAQLLHYLHDIKIELMLSDTIVLDDRSNNRFLNLQSVAEQLGCERLQCLMLYLHSLTPDELCQHFPTIKSLLIQEEKLLSLEMNKLAQ